MYFIIDSPIRQGDSKTFMGQLAAQRQEKRLLLCLLDPFFLSFLILNFGVLKFGNCREELVHAPLLVIILWSRHNCLTFVFLVANSKLLHFTKKSSKNTFYPTLESIFTLTKKNN